jgi:hypothetical protein
VSGPRCARTFTEQGRAMWNRFQSMGRATGGGRFPSFRVRQSPILTGAGISPAENKKSVAPDLAQPERPGGRRAGIGEKRSRRGTMRRCLQAGGRLRSSRVMTCVSRVVLTDDVKKSNNQATVRCQLAEGHAGKHQRSFTKLGKARQARRTRLRMGSQHRRLRRFR